uniref:ATP syntahse CF1 epsilon chain n=1 Tax=Lotharella vacuolata TaxID=74820 RepID=A0A140JZV6_9EUKA|nr:ATP syntahse CF1 epsilon chain [Lotharella vacuolata]BAU62633.1 ATP syntahse CF1 epsilon chain [Lotharella vacuolata]
MKLKITVAIPGKIILNTETTEVIVQTTTGKIGILPNHAPLIAAIETSVLTLKNTGDQKTFLVISDGYISLEKNEIFIATDRCILENKIDKKKLENDYKIALEKYNKAQKIGKKYIAYKTLKRINACYEILNYRRQ